jgi:hypothetical protein
MRDPKQALAECGLEVAANSQIEVVPVSASRTDETDEQLRSWEQASATGIYKLFLPERPPRVETSELTEGDLAKVAGGSAAGPPIQY